MTGDGKILGLNTTFDSSLFQTLARASADRCRGGGNFDALSAIILSYAALEAFVNELSQLARTLVRERDLKLETDETVPTLPEFLETLSLVLRVAEDRWASVEYRYDLAWEVVCRTKVEPGVGARQSLGVMTKLRNDLVHAKSGETELYLHQDAEEAKSFDGFWLGSVRERHEHPRYLRFLDDRRLLNPGTEHGPWLHRICSRAVADWACETAEQLACNLVELTPIGSSFRERLELYSLAGTSKRRRERAALDPDVEDDAQ
jgi:hypothetical protein